MRVSYIVPTIGRPTLPRTLGSIELWPGDEILLLGDAVLLPKIEHPQLRCLPVEPGNDWGATERNVGINAARGDIISFMDDDDVYVDGARRSLEEASPEHPTIFRMRLPSGMVLWTDKRIECGNVGTPMIVVPNEPPKFGTWSKRYVCDLDFISSCKWPEVSWNESVIAEVRPS